ncbi:MAG: tetratricopeptide repeat protein [Rectinemataceae bacterium]
MISRFRMLSRSALLALTIIAVPHHAGAQSSDTAEPPPAQSAAPAQDSTPPARAVEPAAVPAPMIPVVVPVQPQAAAARPDALLLYRQGRDLESAGKTAEAEAKYSQSIAVCNQELAQNPKRTDSHVVKCWSLFRLSKYGEVIADGQAALKIQFDARISEVTGESYFYLDQMDSSLKALQRYVDAAGEDGDRFSTAYFFMGEAYLRLKEYNHADMAYSMAVYKDPGLPRWWYRLGMTCEFLGDWKRAYTAYGKAIALKPDFQEALDAQSKIKAKAGM